MNKNQLLVALIAGITGAPMAFGATVDELVPNADPTGFYGGLAVRDRGSESEGLQFGHLLTSAWSKFTPPATEDGGSRTLAYGGYRWANDVAVEAAVASADRFALQPDAARPGMGLAFANGNEVVPKAWNADVYTSWGFAKKFALYGRLGYVQNDPVVLYPASVLAGNVARNRDGVNYGLGMRYDVNPVLGLRLEYARFGRLAGETMTGPLPDSDHVQFGMQFRF
jgi:Outer membrane protein beta-barrel domain